MALHKSQKRYIQCCGERLANQSIVSPRVIGWTTLAILTLVERSAPSARSAPPHMQWHVHPPYSEGRQGTGGVIALPGNSRMHANDTTPCLERRGRVRRWFLDEWVVWDFRRAGRKSKNGWMASGMSSEPETAFCMDRSRIVPQENYILRPDKNQAVLVGFWQVLDQKQDKFGGVTNSRAPIGSLCVQKHWTADFRCARPGCGQQTPETRKANKKVPGSAVRLFLNRKTKCACGSAGTNVPTDVSDSGAVVRSSTFICEGQSYYCQV
ncbi:hypothetical protein B0H10DRAFT_1965431 [Mycena sp. CBHHK59/15]|nr:hypothetical protein B0H10DRAFT_1965431 [Mycena sp. CBHHK59/15]